MERKGPPIQNEVLYTELGNGIYNLSSPPVGFQQYLIVGEEKALLVDTGIGACPLKPIVEKNYQLARCGY